MGLEFLNDLHRILKVLCKGYVLGGLVFFVACENVDFDVFQEEVDNVEVFAVHQAEVEDVVAGLFVHHGGVSTSCDQHLDALEGSVG